MARRVELFFLAELDHLDLAGTTFRFQEDGTLRMEFVTRAVHPTRWGGLTSFTNSVTGPYPGATTFEDGEPVPEAILQEIKDVHRRLQDEIRWEPGDLAMLDNTRFMHGRRAFSDPQRQHITAMGMANF